MSEQEYNEINHQSRNQRQYAISRSFDNSPMTNTPIGDPDFSKNPDFMNVGAGVADPDKEDQQSIYYDEEAQSDQEEMKEEEEYEDDNENNQFPADSQPEENPAQNNNVLYQLDRTDNLPQFQD
mmetsp:Transcript_4239/g.7188  ORF Transcript_4239/g.7188 Transcript_4239/m.7188 type:complete len:124 (+) Transcript_4239:1715-2086(+)